MSQPDPSALEALLLQLRRGYLQELPDKFERLEAQLLEAGRTGDDSGERFNDFYRQVHSLKGSGGTYGLHVLSSICHQLEDYLQLQAGKPPRLEPGHTGPALRHIDLLREAASRATAGQEHFEAIEHQLAQLREELFPRTLTALVVLSSRATAQLCLQVLATCGFRGVLEPDSHAALRRALTEQFDVLITSPELPVLSGAGLLAAIRLSSQPDRRLRSVLITGGSGAARALRRLIDPDYVLARDQHLAHNLEHTLGEIRAAPAITPR